MAGIFQKIQRWIDEHQDDARVEALLQRLYALSAEASLHSAVVGQRETLIAVERAFADVAACAAMADDEGGAQ